jgi:hypothetical protein
MEIVSGQAVPSVLQGLDPEGKGITIARNIRTTYQIAQRQIPEELYLQ